MKFQRWQSVTPNSKQEEILESRGSGYVTHNGKDICLITQVNSDVTWAINHRSGELVTVDGFRSEFEDLANKYNVEIVSNDVGDYTTFELGYDARKNTNFLRALSRLN